MKTLEVPCYVVSQKGLSDSLITRMDEKYQEAIKRKASKKKSEKLMTIEETMAFLKCSKQALWNWNKNGILLSHKIGRRVYYKKSEILNQLVKQV